MVCFYCLSDGGNMKKMVCIIIALLVGSSFANAQSNRNYFGIRLGFPEIGVQIGSTNIFARNIGGRLTLDFAFAGNGVLVGADVLGYFNIPTPGSSLDVDVYAGAGAAVGLRSNNNNLAFDIHLVLGLELLLSKSFGLFVEARPVGFGDSGFSFAGAIGINFRI
jgi:hypothetical protein